MHSKQPVLTAAQYCARLDAATAAVVGTAHAARQPAGCAQADAHAPPAVLRAGHAKAALLAQAAAHAAAGSGAEPSNPFPSSAREETPLPKAGSCPERKLLSTASDVSAARRASSAGSAPVRKLRPRSLRRARGEPKERSETPEAPQDAQ